MCIRDRQSGDVTTTPNEVGIITASDATTDDRFGYSVAVGSNRIVVGARETHVINGDTLYHNAGSLYIYDFDQNEIDIINPSDRDSIDKFGTSVAVGCGKIVVGAPHDENNGNINEGSAYIYDLNGNNEVKITFPAAEATANAYFGSSVAVGSGRIVVGSSRKNNSQGSAYIYDLDGNEVGIITASDGAEYDYFGTSVAVGCDRIVVGADNNDDNGPQSGSAYIYDLDGNEVGIITASDGTAGDFFGDSVAVGSGRIVVGAPDKTIGSNEDQGAAYIYDLDGNEVDIITASDGAADDHFGSSVAVGSGRIVVGAVRKNNFQGVAYIYDLDGNEVGIITASDGAADDYFGESVAVGSGRIVVGAVNAGITGINTTGKAYVYDTPLVYNLYDAIDLNYDYG